MLFLLFVCLKQMTSYVLAIRLDSVESCELYPSGDSLVQNTNIS